MVSVRNGGAVEHGGKRRAGVAAVKRWPEWAVGCPVCKAEAGATCVDLLRNPQRSHSQRVAVWQALAREQAAAHYGGSPMDNGVSTAHGQPLPDSPEREASRAHIAEAWATLAARGHPRPGATNNERDAREGIDSER